MREDAVAVECRRLNTKAAAVHNTNGTASDASAVVLKGAIAHETGSSASHGDGAADTGGTVVHKSAVVYCQHCSSSD
eukprot:SAG31_NODE_47086_length_251_cov_1.684211_1_plen_76_part_01